MTAIGKFQSNGAEIVGEICTLDHQIQNVRIVRETGTTGEQAPTHRVFVGRAEIGAAWSKTTSEQKAYLSLKLDDPSFKYPIFANLFQDAPGDYTLVWSRSRS